MGHLNPMSTHAGDSPRKQFHQRCCKGIPSRVRGRVWKILLDVEAKKAQNPGIFEMLKEQARLHCDQFHLIDIAVQWTFPNHLLFRERYGMKQRALFEVLAAYAMYNPEVVGYGQGLSHIVALLLMWLGEEDAFWALVQLMENEKYSMSGLYKPGSPMLETLLEHLGHIVHRTLPTLGKHLEKQGVKFGDTIARWFTQGFLDEVPFPLALRIWDIFILEGAHVLSTMGYVALKLNRKCLLKRTRNHIGVFLQVTLRQEWDMDDDAVIKQLQASKHELAKRKCLLPPAAKLREACTRL
ncbi:USP6 N-terminal-like protein [Ochotona princeps]|uniref:USP6 N-terminal-like protein n=1 Tax=Ochotona princeps TaxID=9978 RepID=UPI0027155FA9|nr:USP6 N-terminal-like protein [Ochotona princeps]